MATVLDKELKRQVTIDGAEYTVAVDPDGLRLIGKGKRKPEVELRWRDLLSGDAAMAVALNASLSKNGRPATKPATETVARASAEARAQEDAALAELQLAPRSRAAAGSRQHVSRHLIAIGLVVEPVPRLNLRRTREGAGRTGPPIGRRTPQRAQLDETPRGRDAGGLGARGRAELAHDRRHVRLDGTHLDPELTSDRLVGCAECDEAQHLNLA